MQEKGINSTFKKLINESSEMVFLADDTFPYAIFYTNNSFEKHIGSSLLDRSLIGLELDISSFIFKEELEFSYGGNQFDFHMEVPQDSETNYFLFYKGKKSRTHGLATKREFQHFLVESPDANVVLKPDGEIILLNKEAIKLFGLANNTELTHFKELGSLFNDYQDWKH